MEHNVLRILECTGAFGTFRRLAQYETMQILSLTAVSHKELCQVAIQSTGFHYSYFSILCVDPTTSGSLKVRSYERILPPSLVEIVRFNIQVEHPRDDVHCLTKCCPMALHILSAIGQYDILTLLRFTTQFNTPAQTGTDWIPPQKPTNIFWPFDMVSFLLDVNKPLLPSFAHGPSVF